MAFEATTAYVRDKRSWHSPWRTKATERLFKLTLNLSLKDLNHSSFFSYFNISFNWMNLTDAGVVKFIIRVMVLYRCLEIINIGTKQEYKIETKMFLCSTKHSYRYFKKKLNEFNESKYWINYFTRSAHILQWWHSFLSVNPFEFFQYEFCRIYRICNFLL